MASENTNILNIVGNVTDPTQMVQPDGSVPPLVAGRQTEPLVDDLHGKYYTPAYRGKSFEANVAAVTVPVVASNLVSVFTLFNPQSSGINMELIDVTAAQALAATVVTQLGWYYSTPVLSLKGTFTTLGTVNAGLVGSAQQGGNRGLFYSAYTHSGTPVLTDVIGSWGAVTNLQTNIVNKQYDGRLILPPGIAMSIAGATAAETATGLNLEVRWTEWPL